VLHVGPDRVHHRIDQPCGHDQGRGLLQRLRESYETPLGLRYLTELGGRDEL
jgi:hypothetical protein